MAHEVPVYFGMMIATFLLPPPPAAAPDAAPTAGTFPRPAIAAVAESLQGKVAAVSGAGHGFGRQIALSLVAVGAKVYACDGPGETARKELAALLPFVRLLPGTIEVGVVDFTDEAAVREWVALMPSLDILVLNAGGVLGNTGQPIEEVSMSSWDDIFAVNVRSSMVAAQASSPLLKRSTHGRIVTISSGAGLRASLTGIQAYCSAKHALVGLTKQLAHELGPFGVTVNSVAPGLVLSNDSSRAQYNRCDEAQQKAIIEGIALKRLGSASDIADAVLFFASSASSWCSGQVLSVDGGR